MDREAFQTWTAGHIRLLDGATGSNLRAAGMPAGVCSEDWIRSHPDTLIAGDMTTTGEPVLPSEDRAYHRLLDLYT